MKTKSERRDLKVFSTLVRVGALDIYGLVHYTKLSQAQIYTSLKRLKEGGAKLRKRKIGISVYYEVR